VIVYDRFNTGIGPDGTSEAFIQAGGEHRPFAAVGEPDDADVLGVHFGHLGESGEAVGGHVGQERKRLSAQVLSGFDEGVAGIAALLVDGARRTN
jgi:hypothetical protein